MGPLGGGASSLFTTEEPFTGEAPADAVPSVAPEPTSSTAEEAKASADIVETGSQLLLVISLLPTESALRVVLESTKLSNFGLVVLAAPAASSAPRSSTASTLPNKDISDDFLFGAGRIFDIESDEGGAGDADSIDVAAVQVSTADAARSSQEATSS
jgi:hypothetical protein